jgi:hypothetical protein
MPGRFYCLDDTRINICSERNLNVTKARLEGLFVDELERLQPTPGYMRLLKESVLQVWHERKSGSW